jgi:DNA repair protein RadC
MYKYGEVISDSNAAFKQLFPLFKKYLRKQETMVAIALNARHCIIGRPWRMSLGTLQETSTHPRDLFREAIRRNAFAVIIAHNHPSGEAMPSEEDKRLTKRMKEAGSLLGIALLDHLIITSSNNHWSFNNNDEL